jgi:hypothetical protein
MWIFTVRGPVSIVRIPAHVLAAKPRKFKEYVYQVRGRDKASLGAVRAAYAMAPGALCKGPRQYASRVEHTPGHDYAYRFYLTQQGLEHMLQWMAGDIDYDNFKTAAAYGTAPPWYMGVLLRVWSVWARAWAWDDRDLLDLDTVSADGPGYTRERRHSTTKRNIV